MNTTSDIRVRFAPSPTGFLHVGGLRTALYNYLFARHHKGKFILRIEDTDQTRFVEGAVENLISTLRWIGIDYDEGPDRGGEYGPYIQSQRLELYQTYAKQLLELDKAYYCFCASDELEIIRKQQNTEKSHPMHNHHCRNLSADHIQKNLDDGKQYVIRMKIPLHGEVEFHDIIRGDITVAYNVIDDQVILKSDGFPTYHLANVVDDHLMKISHIIRGEEWLPSTPKHILLYRAFDWDIPQYAHLSLLLNKDRSKLSKRQGDVAVEDYKAKGYLPETLLNFVALLGWHTSDDREIFSLDELIENFSLDRVGKTGAIFDIEKLNWMNAQYLKRYSLDQLTEMCIPYLQKAGYDVTDRNHIRTMVETVSTRVNYLASITDHVTMFSDDPVTFENAEAKEMIQTSSSQKVFLSFITFAEQITDWSRDEFKSLMKEVQKESGIKGKDLFMPVRIALTGNMHGPELPLIAEVFGKKKCLQRIKNILLPPQ